MLAPAYKSFGESGGFGGVGDKQWNASQWIAVILAVVIGVLCYYLVSYFRELNLKQYDAAVAAKKAADARLAGGSLEEGVGNVANANAKTALLSS